MSATYGFKAAVLTKIDGPLEIWSVYPRSLEYGQVLVKVLVSGICGAQLQEIRGEKGNAAHCPHLLGHEGCGIVEAIGPGVTRVKAGDKVVMHWRKAAGIEAAAATYFSANGPTVGAGRVTTLSEKAVVSENRLTPVPAVADEELCALLGCSLSTALGTIENEAHLKMGESLLVIGCGGLGGNLLRCARLAHASPIACCDVHAGKSDLAMTLGADRFFDALNGPQWKKGSKFDVVIDTSGSPWAIELGLESLAPSGRFIMIGHIKPDGNLMIKNADSMFDGTGKTIKATQGGGFVPDRDIPRYVELWAKRILKIEGLVTARFPLHKINDALDLVRKGEAGRVMIEMSHI